jgi:hypothetical protein
MATVGGARSKTARMTISGAARHALFFRRQARYGERANQRFCQYRSRLTDPATPVPDAEPAGYTAFAPITS